MGDVNCITAVILGIVEGITEFIPVSSTGHLVLAGHLLGADGPKASVFEVFIQLGAILAVVVVSFDRFLGLLDFRSPLNVNGRRGLWRIFLTTLPALVAGFLLHGVIKSYLFNPLTVMLGLGAGGLAILVIERWVKGRSLSGLETITAKQALAIGVCQCFALWPGISRSASTILGGMVFGLDRTAAVRYSFLAAVPTMVAAVAYDLWKARHVLQPADAPVFAVGFIVSFVVAILAIRFFLKLLARLDLRPFGWYRIILAALGLLWMLL